MVFRWKAPKELMVRAQLPNCDLERLNRISAQAATKA
jgi:hypothetical protein